MIIGLAGTKQSGKSTASEFIQANFFRTFSDKSCRIYSLAYPLKQICRDYFGLSNCQCYGNDNEKNSFTKLKWEDMPGVCCNTHLHEDLNTITDTPLNYLTFHEPGYMTAREVMQFVGTNIFRKMYSNIWTQKLFQTIYKDNCDLAIIDDCRFVNEVRSIFKKGGIIFHLTRTIANDNHSSEQGLKNIDKNLFIKVIHNENMPVLLKNQIIWSYVKEELCKLND